MGLARALSGGLPFGDAGFDRVLSSMFFHHLPPEEKVTTLREIVRVLRPGGALVAVDLGVPSTGYAAVMGKLWSHLEHATENTAGALPTMMLAAGFEDVRELGGQETVVGSIAFYRAVAARTS
jgi:ubiquinone/menaquinone biosynthesis C-methylase UbiE